MLTVGEARKIKSKRRFGRLGATCLYRLYGVDGSLLYVGVTGRSLAQRFNAHSRTQGWWEFVAGVLVEWHEEEWKALRAEREAIRSEEPRFNIRSRAAHENRRSGS